MVLKIINKMNSLTMNTNLYIVGPLFHLEKTVLLHASFVNLHSWTSDVDNVLPNFYGLVLCRPLLTKSIIEWVSLIVLMLLAPHGCQYLFSSGGWNKIIKKFHLHLKRMLSIYDISLFWKFPPTSENNRSIVLSSKMMTKKLPKSNPTLIEAGS